MLSYGDKVYGLRGLLQGMEDTRERPQIGTDVVVGGALVMALARMGSLNALEQCKDSGFWRRWLGGNLPSADTTGRVFAGLDCEKLRDALQQVYSRLKRNKALRPIWGREFALAIDGHESSASYLRCCPKCMRRRVTSKKWGERTQYYHRNVTAMLLTKPFPVLLDVEPQRCGEDEGATAKRLLGRVLECYPRAFSVVVGDSLYAQGPFFRLAREHGKDVVAVLKNGQRDLMEDALALFAREEPVVLQRGRGRRLCWDMEGFTSWPQAGPPVRVVRSLETTTVRSQMTGHEEEERSHWVWVTTLSKERFPTESLVDLAHARWDIENKELNELVTRWHADHLYKHSPVAIVAFWLLVMLAYNLFHAFISLNLKPALRFRRTALHWAQHISAELYQPHSYMLPPVPT